MKIKPTLNYLNDNALDDLYTIKRANEWITASKVRPVPKMLFGECWLENELVVLTGPSGVNISVLAVQIGESIAGGANIEPFARTAAIQPVLYVDLKLSDKQFEMRYAAESEPEDEFLKDHYRFSDNFHRIEVDMTKRLPEGCGSWTEVLPLIIERTVRENEAKVVIIDDLTSVQSSIYGYRETPPLMRELNRLKREMGLSILVLATDAGLDTTRTPTSLRLLERFADSVFIIGQGRSDPAISYIKQLRSRSTDMMYDQTHVPSFLVVRSDDNFLGFELLTYDNEKTINNIRDDPDWPMIDRIKELSDEGNSIRKIAEMLGESKTTVHRWLQLWEPEEERPQPVAVEQYDKEFAEDAPDPLDFPGREEYNEALAHPRFNGLYRDSSPRQRLLQREYGDIDTGRHEARQEWLATGKAPTLTEMLIRKGWTVGAEAAGARVVVAAAEAVAVEETEQEPCVSETPEGTETSETFDESSLLTPTRYRGRDILVEKFYEDGKPHVWYDVNKNGQKIRVEKGLFGTISSLV